MLAIKTERATELDRLADFHGRGRCILATFTVRHGFDDDVSDLRKAKAEAFRMFCQGRPWIRFKEKIGLIGHARVLEVTHGYSAGFHPHLHVLLLVDDPKDPRWAGWENWMRERWITICERLTERPAKGNGRFSLLPVERHAKGDEAEALFRELARARKFVLKPSQVPDWKHAVELTYGARASYLAKLGLELAEVGGKNAKEGHRTPLQIAADYARAHRKRDAELWSTYAKAFFRARFLTWSRGLKDLAGIKDRTDDELSACPIGEWICRVDGSTWDRVRRQPGFKSGLLEAVELGGAERARLFVTIAENRSRVRCLAPPDENRTPENDTRAEWDLPPLPTLDPELHTAEALERVARSTEWYFYRHREKYAAAKERFLAHYLPRRMWGDELGGGVPDEPNPQAVREMRRCYQLAVEGKDPMSTEPVDPETTPPPLDLDAEAAVLSALLLREHWIDGVDLEPADFYSIANRRVFEALLELRKENVPHDVVTVAHRLRRTERLKQVGGMAYLGRLLDATPAIENVATHAAIVRECRNARDLIDRCRIAMGQLYAGADPRGVALELSENATRAARGERIPCGEVVPIRWTK